jgi:hypothetical protein
MKDVLKQECTANIAAFEKKMSVYHDEFKATYLSAASSLYLPANGGDKMAQ